VILALLAIGAVDAHASPTSVTVFGNLQSEAGCPADFDALCAQTHMAQSQNPSDQVWRLTLDLPTGSYNYYAALNDGLAELYGKNATLSGPAIDLSVTSGPVRFYYDDVTHWITDSRNSTIAGVVGSFQSELGCASDFMANCLRGWLEDPDGDKIYRFSTSGIPAGVYSVLVVHDETFDSIGSPQRDFTVPADALTCFSYSPVSHVLDISFGACAPSSALVPAPSSIALMCFSIIGMAAWRIRPRARRRRQERGRVA
jgi:hypothetical protein